MIATFLKAQFEDLEISEISIWRFLTQKSINRRPSSESEEWSWAKAVRLQFWKYNKNMNWDDVFYTDEFSFYLRSPEINRWAPKNHHNYVKNINIRIRFTHGAHSEIKESSN